MQLLQVSARIGHHGMQVSVTELCADRQERPERRRSCRAHSSRSEQYERLLRTLKEASDQRQHWVFSWAELGVTWCAKVSQALMYASVAEV